MDKAQTFGKKAYQWLRSYISFYMNKVYYRDVYVIGKENIPAPGTPLLFVSDHQNSLNDALGIATNVTDRHVHFITRADIFEYNKNIGAFIRWLGGLPAYRLSFEGEEALSNNTSTFEEAENKLLEGNSIIIYPEAGHQDKHWLGFFSLGYTKLAFEAAEKCGFEQEIFIVPSCNHYSSYTDFRSQILIRFGEPVSLKPYYELYKTKPRTAQRQVNAIVRSRISEMMLNVTDLDNYPAIDYIRRNKYGSDFAKRNGLDPENLQQKLEADKKLFASLEVAKSENPEAVQSIYDRALKLSGSLRDLGVEDAQFEDEPSLSTMLLSTLAILITLPLAVIGIWPAVICWLIPQYFSRNMKDPTLACSVLIGVNLIVLIPLTALITLLTGIFGGHFLGSLIYILAFPLVFMFEWTWFSWIGRWLKDFRWLRARKAGKIESLRNFRAGIFDSLDTILKK